jgi:hypothetical protein
VDQFALAFSPAPGIGHNRPPEPVDPIGGLNARLAVSHADLVARFCDLELAYGRVPNPIDSEEDAATATDFIAQSQAHIKKTEVVHKQEKALFLKTGRSVDAFFKRRCDTLNSALAPATSRLKAYRDELARAEARRHEATRRAAAEEAHRAAAEAEEHRTTAARRAGEAQSLEGRRRAAEALRLAEEAAARAAAAHEQAMAVPEPTRIRGDYALRPLFAAAGASRSSSSTGCRANI